MDSIFIEGLQFSCIIGIYERERIEPQPLEIDVDMQTDIGAAARSGELDQSLNYAEISEQIITFCQRKRAELIETLAEELAEMLLESFKTRQLTLTIRKPMAVPEATSVGVRITRQKS